MLEKYFKVGWRRPPSPANYKGVQTPPAGWLEHAVAQAERAQAVEWAGSDSDPLPQYFEEMQHSIGRLVEVEERFVAMSNRIEAGKLTIPEVLAVDEKYGEFMHKYEDTLKVGKNVRALVDEDKESKSGEGTITFPMVPFSRCLGVCEKVGVWMRAFDEVQVKGMLPRTESRPCVLGEVEFPEGVQTNVIQVWETKYILPKSKEELEKLQVGLSLAHEWKYISDKEVKAMYQEFLQKYLRTIEEEERGLVAIEKAIEAASSSKCNICTHRRSQ